MSDSNSSHVLIREAELHAASAVAEARFDDAASETKRIMLARAFLGAAFEVERAVRMHSRCALVNHCGTLGANNLSEATDVLFHALANYAASIHDLVEQDMRTAAC